ncbi:hypothetical protein PR048_008265, partial [Dryococelus australis]
MYVCDNEERLVGVAARLHKPPRMQPLSARSKCPTRSLRSRTAQLDGNSARPRPYRNNMHVGPVPWPARSPDLSPLDVFFWGILKSRVYSGRRSDTRDQLLQTITDAINQLRIEPACIQWQRSTFNVSQPAYGHIRFVNSFADLSEGFTVTEQTRNDMQLFFRGFLRFAPPLSLRLKRNVLPRFLLRTSESAGSLPDSLVWESCRAIQLIGRFSWGYSVSPSFHSGAAPHSPKSPSSALKTSLSRAAHLTSTNVIESAISARCKEYGLDTLTVVTQSVTMIVERGHQRRKVTPAPARQHYSRCVPWRTDMPRPLPVVLAATTDSDRFCQTLVQTPVARWHLSRHIPLSIFKLDDGRCERQFPPVDVTAISTASRIAELQNCASSYSRLQVIHNRRFLIFCNKLVFKLDFRWGIPTSRIVSALKFKGRDNGGSQRKPANQRCRLARFPVAKIRSEPGTAASNTKLATLEPVSVRFSCAFAHPANTPRPSHPEHLGTAVFSALVPSLAEVHP